MDLKCLSNAKGQEIKEAVAKVAEKPNLATAFEINEKRKGIFKVSTGCMDFDYILGGGIKSMSITEAYGEHRSGKTQLAHTLCGKYH